MRVMWVAVLVLAAAPASAEWLKYGENDSGTYLYDPASVKREGDLVRVWEIHNLRKRDSGALSRRILWEYDCKSERKRLLQFTFHAAAMAGGKVLRSYNKPTGWDSNTPGTAAAALHKIVCSQQGAGKPVPHRKQ